MEHARYFMTNVLYKVRCLQPFIHKVQIASFDKNKATYELQIEKHHCNLSGTLHGGMASTLLDILTACTALSVVGVKDKRALSVEMKIRFLSPARMGETILLETKVLRTGKTLMFTEMDIVEKLSRKLVAQGTHIMYLIDQKIEDDCVDTLSQMKPK
ncbi:acyl-coenzyme A thioesterase 13-like [Ornithodoros turicata]|uniref:acyl-coenzyme A thioesterase 13-like n=1 Tax=Ornithodoros turicata TaxID=34597 RepID=UPI003139132A